MADTSKLKDMLQDLINDRQEQASLNLHDYLVDKMRDINGTSVKTEDEVTASDGTETETEVEELNLDTTN